MLKMSKLSSIIVMVLIVGLVILSFDRQGITEEKLFRQGKTYYLSDAEIKKLQGKALSGAPEAAWRLSLFYDLYQHDYKEGRFWERIAAENGDPSGEYSLGLRLKEDRDPRNQERAIFWLKRASAKGEKLAEKELKRLKKQLGEDIGN
jgi:TPR repeat protein